MERLRVQYERIRQRLASSWVTFPFSLWLVTRFLLFWMGGLSLRISPRNEFEGGDALLRRYRAWDAMCRWDCGWFSQLARRGYQSALETNFWPGLPMTVKALSSATRIPTEFLLVIVPNLAALGAYLTLYRVYTRVEDESAARCALLVFVAFPFAFFQASGYPESMMIFFSALATLLAMRQQHAAAGIALGLGVLSRHLSILMGPTLLAAQLKQRGLKGFFRSPQVLTLALPFLVAGIYLFYCWRAWGDPLSWWKARAQWGTAAWWGVPQMLANVGDMPHFAAYMLFALIPTAGAVALVVRRKAPELAAPAVMLLAVLWTVGAAGLGRYSASCWPAFLPWGVWLSKKPWLLGAVVGVLAFTQAIFFFLHVHHFAIL